MVLDVEQHQPAVSKRVDGAQDEGRHQGSEEGAPQRLEGEVVADLEQRATGEVGRLAVAEKFQPAQSMSLYETP